MTAFGIDAFRAICLEKSKRWELCLHSIDLNERTCAWYIVY